MQKTRFARRRCGKGVALFHVYEIEKVGDAVSEVERVLDDFGV